MVGIANKIQTHENYFRKRPEEGWKPFAERLYNSLRGLASKTGSFGGVWQDPGKADISAMDRHMARNFLPQVLEDPTLGPVFRDSAVANWIKGKKRVKVKAFDELMAHETGQNFALDQITKQVNATSGGKRQLKGGLLNPSMPEHLWDVPFSPDGKYTTTGPIYQRMLDANAESAQKQGLSVFGEQWRLWDRIRKSLEPHETMYPGLHNLPALSGGELLDARNVHSKAGFFGTWARRPYDWRKGLYWSVPATGLLGAGAYPSDATPEE